MTNILYNKIMIFYHYYFALLCFAIIIIICIIFTGIQGCNVQKVCKKMNLKLNKSDQKTFSLVMKSAKHSFLVEITRRSAQLLKFINQTKTKD